MFFCLGVKFGGQNVNYEKIKTPPNKCFEPLTKYKYNAKLKKSKKKEKKIRTLASGRFLYICPN